MADLFRAVCAPVAARRPRPCRQLGRAALVCGGCGMTATDCEVSSSLGHSAGHSHNPTRKRRHDFDRSLYRHRNRIERTIGRLKDFRRIATRYDKLACNYLAPIHLAATLTWWL
jgi:transposase